MPKQCALVPMGRKKRVGQLCQASTSTLQGRQPAELSFATFPGAGRLGIASSHVHPKDSKETAPQLVCELPLHSGKGVVKRLTP